MQFVFNGAPGESLDGVNMYGTWFALGVPTAIGGAGFIARLSRHPHFSAVASEPAAEVEPAAQEAAPEVAAPRRGRPPKAKG